MKVSIFLEGGASPSIFDEGTCPPVPPPASAPMELDLKYARQKLRTILRSALDKIHVLLTIIFHRAEVLDKTRHDKSSNILTLT